jgi:hypothetical protein
MALYGVETWTLTRRDGKRETIHLERKVLRKIYGAVNEKGQWRIRRNMELYQLHKDLDMVTEIKKRRHHWIGHVENGRKQNTNETHTQQSRRATKKRKAKKAVGRGCRRVFEEDGLQGLAKKSKGEKRNGRTSH